MVFYFLNIEKIRKKNSGSFIDFYITFYSILNSAPTGACIVYGLFMCLF